MIRAHNYRKLVTAAVRWQDLNTLVPPKNGIFLKPPWPEMNLKHVVLDTPAIKWNEPQVISSPDQQWNDILLH